MFQVSSIKAGHWPLLAAVGLQRRRKLLARHLVEHLSARPGWGDLGDLNESYESYENSHYPLVN